jgi:DNA mismatch repair protein MutS
LKSDLFEQHARLKGQYPGVLLLLRVGDFYEALDDDADAVARVCNLAKTTRADHRMAGFPHMQLDRFLAVLVKAGFRVATCETLPTQPAPGKPKVVRWPPCAEEGESCSSG